MNREAIARAAHEINRAYCAALGDTTQPAWEDAPDWQKGSALAGVDMHLANPDATPEDSHASWLAQKLAEGWKYGPVKDVAKKEHPCCVPYEELPTEQKAKDYLFRRTVHLFAELQENVALTVAVAAAEAGVPVVVAATTREGYTRLEYVGHRASHTDNHAGSGLVFEPGEPQWVPDAIAKKLLKLPGVFAEAALVEGDTSAAAITTEQVAASEAEKDREEQQLEDARQTISMMTKAALESYAKTNFGVQLDRAAKIADMRAEVTRLFDQFGAA